MIRDPARKEPKLITDNPTTDVPNNRSRSDLAEEEEEVKLILLDINSASKNIVKKTQNTLSIFEQLRWVRKTKTNQQILRNFLIKRIIIHKFSQGQSYSYDPSCNLFCNKRRFFEREEKQKLVVDCSDLLLGKSEVEKIFAMRSEVRRKHQFTKYNEFRKLFKDYLLTYFKTNASLTKLNAFVEGLPQVDGCFELPLLNKNPFPTWVEPSSLRTSNKPLKIKVDLFSHDPWIDDKNLLPTSPSHDRNGKSSPRTLF